MNTYIKKMTLKCQRSLSLWLEAKACFNLWLKPLCISKFIVSNCLSSAKLASWAPFIIITLIRARISKHVPSEVLDEIIYQFQNFNSKKWMNDVIPNFMKLIMWVKGAQGICIRKICIYLYQPSTALIPNELKPLAVSSVWPHQITLVVY